jgi:hypothetical protein
MFSENILRKKELLELQPLLLVCYPLTSYQEEILGSSPTYLPLQNLPKMKSSNEPKLPTTSEINEKKFWELALVT